VQGREAKHGPSGLVVRFLPHPDGGWDGTPANGQEIAQALIELHGRDVAVQTLTRLMREAGDIFQEKNNEHRN
jgi:hypothetical protein